MQKDFIDSLGLDDQTAQRILEAHQQVVDGYAPRIRAMTVDAAVQQAVSAAGGRNLKAIRALLDESAFGEDPADDAKAAVAAVKRENPYLFAGAQVTAPGTGGFTPPAYSQAELGKLPLAEYRRYRKGM